MVSRVMGGHLRLDGGSGFIADKSGLVVTNMHVIHKDHLHYEVTTSDSTTRKAKLVGIDVANDIAFLKINDRGSFPALTLGNSNTLKLGQDVLAIGNALGIFENTVTKGIISGLARAIEAGNESTQESLRGLIQTDAAINPGNSGGPLLNSAGKVIGINAAMVAKAENISFAIPIDTVKKDITRIKKFGTLQKSFLGVQYVMLDKKTAHELGIKQSQGALIISSSPHQSPILPNSPAESAGLKMGDIITKFNKSPLTASHTLSDALENKGGNKKITLTIKRNNKEKTIELFLPKYPV